MTPSKHDVPPHTPPEPSKQAMSDEIAAQVAAFQAKGGKVNEVPTKTAREVIDGVKLKYKMNGKPIDE